MANIRDMYDPTAEAQQDFGALPTGEYLAEIIDSVLKDTKSGNGKYLELTYEVLDGPMRNRKVWCRINLVNANAQAQEIGNRQFRSIREATGVLDVTDSVQLHNKPHIIRVEMIKAGTVQKNGTTTTRDGNDIKSWKPAPGATPAAATAPAATAAPWGTRAA